jgi:hypothetical protein
MEGTAVFRRENRIALAMALVLLLPVGCGSRSGLFAEDETLGPIDAGVSVDTGISAVDGGDESPPPPPPPPPACKISRLRVFVTSTLHDANFGGLSGADAVCAARAKAQRLGGLWRAWLSDTSHTAQSRLDQPMGGFALLDGTTVANNAVALFSGTLVHAIDLTELGTPISDGNTEVWTGTGLTGEGNAGYCADSSGRDWSSDGHTAPTPLVGHENAADPSWTAVYLQFCDRTNVRLYCFEVCN